MPIPKPNNREDQTDFISRCVREIINEYEQDQALGICYSQWRESMGSDVSEEAQQGGVVPSSFGRTPFVFPPNNKESKNDFMNRCMKDDSVREKKKDRITRAGFCFRQFNERYMNSIGMKWR